MTDVPRTVREHVEAQGFLGLEDGLVCQINYWLRLSPAICMGWAAVGTGLQSAPCCGAWFRSHRWGRCCQGIRSVSCIPTAFACWLVAPAPPLSAPAPVKIEGQQE